MKPQFKREEIYIDLSKLSGEERLLTPKIIDSQDIFLKDFINDGNFTDYYDLHFGKYGWTISKNLEDSEKQEITFSEFSQLFSEGEEVLQVENYTREDIEKAYRAGEKGATYYFKDTTTQIQTDKAELLEALEKISKVTNEGYMTDHTDFQVWELELKQVHSEIESLIQKHKQ